MSPAAHYMFSMIDGILVGVTLAYIRNNRYRASRSTLLSMGVLGGLAGLHFVLMHVIW